jgi:protein-tyrosine phosphatase
LTCLRDEASLRGSVRLKNQPFFKAPKRTSLSATAFSADWPTFRDDFSLGWPTSLAKAIFISAPVAFFSTKVRDMESTQKYVKDSDNNPLRVDPVDFPPGQVGISICPGKYDDYARSGPCHRDVLKDLTLVKNWGANILVTILEDKEMELLRVTHLPQVAKSLGFSWWRFPVPDERPIEIVGHPVLDPKFDVWTLPNAILRRFVKAGGRALIHCRGGLGRTGTLVCRLLIEEGHSPDEALALVRRSRRGSVENREQENHLYALPGRLAQKQPLLEALTKIPDEDQGNPIATLFNDPVNFHLEEWVKTVKDRLPPEVLQ